MSDQEQAIQTLVVDDEAVVALDLQGRLEKLGYPPPVVASSSAEAIQIALAVRPAVILMDIQLGPGRDGIAVAKEILKTVDASIVYVTAYSDEETIRRARITEPMGYLLKPFNDRELHATIQIAVYKQEMQAKLAAGHADLQQRHRELRSINRMFQQNLEEQFDIVDSFKDVVESVVDLHGALGDLKALAGRSQWGLAMDLAEKMDNEVAQVIKRAMAQPLPDSEALKGLGDGWGPPANR